MPLSHTDSTVEAGTYYNNGQPTKQFVRNLIEDKQLVSSGHWGWPKPPGYADVGGPFTVITKRNEANPVSVACMGGYTAYTKHHYIGNVYGSLLGGAGPSADIYTGDGAAWGPDAYARMKPTKPSFAGLNAIYELREVPSMLRQRMLTPHPKLGSALKDCSNYWLALQFGWKPLLNDILNCVQFQQGAQKKLKWLLRNNGKPVKTRANLAWSQSTSDRVTTPGGVPNPSFVSYFYSGGATTTKSTQVSDLVWSTATWKYWLPDGPRDIVWTTKMMGRLFGLNPTPKVVWNALPWTWLIDWFNNTGDILENLDAGVADTLTAAHLYIMRERESREMVDYHCTYYGYPDKSLTSVTANATRVFNSKTRLKGNPFGWGINPNDLSPMQLSILGALGKSRL